MGNVLRFPMNTPLAAMNPVHGQTDSFTGEGLLQALAFVREALAGGADKIDAAKLRLCTEAVDDALAAAAVLEQTLIHQTLRLDELARVASTDALTGIYNRRGFEQEFQRALAAANRYGETGILIYVDLDGFKPINDTYGHPAGDAVLVEVARTLSEGVRPHDLVARLGGDEFAVLLTRTTWEDGLARAEVIKHTLNTTYVRWAGKHIAVRASLGFQRFGPDVDAHTLLSEADSAMFEAKRLRADSRDASSPPPPGHPTDRPD